MRSALRLYGLLPAALLVACGGDAPADSSLSIDTTTTVSGPTPYSFEDLPEFTGAVVESPAGTVPVLEAVDGPTLIAVIDGFEEPESTLYDDERDVWYVSAFTGSAGDADANGRITVLDGENLQVVSEDWARATAASPFHSGRGMTLQGDTLWVADLNGVHGFHRRTGEQVAFVDLSGLEPGFLNDLDTHPNGSLWVTDTGGDRIIQVRPEAGVVVDVSTSAGSPNGILWSGSAQGFLIGSWNGTDSLFAVDPLLETARAVSHSPGVSRTDGLVRWSGVILGAAQGDSSIHAYDIVSGEGRAWFPLDGRPADIGIDRGRSRLVVPYVSRGLIEVWQLGDVRVDAPLDGGE